MILNRKTAFILPVFLTLLTLGLRAQVSDDFSDGDFSSNPTWQGSTDLFVVDFAVLRSNSPSAANYYLSTANGLMDETQWDFWINLDFATSGANYVDVYLVSDNADLSLAENAYFLRFGGTPDEISFYKILDGTMSQLIDGEDGLIGSSNNIFAIHVTRTGDGNWQIQYDEDATGVFEDGGAVTDNTVTSTTAFGFRIEQSSAASPVNSHYFDDIEVGPIPVDETPPALLAVTAVSDTELTAVFSEALEQNSAENVANYQIDLGIGNPATAVLNTENANTVNLILGSDLTNGTTYTLSASGLTDLAGNVMDE